MRRITLATFILLAFCVSAKATIQPVQSFGKETIANGQSSLTITTNTSGSAFTIGVHHTLLLCSNWSGGASTPTYSGDTGTVTNIVSTTWLSGNRFIHCDVILNTVGGGTSLTVSFSPNVNNIDLSADEYPIGGTGVSVDTSNFTANGSTTGSISSASITPASNEELIVGVIFTDCCAVPTPGTNVAWTRSSTNLQNKIFEYFQQTTSAAITAQATVSANWIAGIIAFGTPPNITQGVTAVNQGQTFTFTELTGETGTWSVSGTDGSGNATTAQGSINSGSGLYTAPSTVTVKNSLGGCQLLPQNHILNTRIDGLSVNSNSAAWIAQADTNRIQFYSETPTNIIDNTTPTVSVASQNNSSGSGTYQILGPPNGAVEHGWYHVAGQDQHYYAVNHQTCQFEELYNADGPGGATDFSTVVGAIQYPSSGYAFPVPSGQGQSGSDVGATPSMLAMQLHKQEQYNAVAASGAITHAMRVTAPNGEMHGGSGGIGVAFLWPAANPQFAGFGGTNGIPMGARARLKSSFVITGFTAAQQIILTAWKRYGVIFDDGGFGQWSIKADDTYWNDDPEVGQLFQPTIHPSDFEFVDESSFMINANSGECTCNREIVTFTRTSDSATATVDVALVGVTIGTPYDVLNFATGAAPLQLQAFVNGTGNTAVTWTMSPTVGTLTSGGLYTPPSSLPATSGNLTTTIITATASASPNPVATIHVNVIPTQNNGGLYLFGGSSSIFGAQGVTWPYTDPNGVTWQEMTQTFLYSGSLTAGSTTSPPWPTLNAARIYLNSMQPGQIPTNDARFDVYVRPGIFSVTSKFADTVWTTSGNESTDPELQGSFLATNFNQFTAAGGQFKPIDLINPNTLALNGKLSFVLRVVSGLDMGVAGFQILPVCVGWC